MTIYEQVMALYPELTDCDFMTVITLQNDSDGKGDYIAKWEHTLPRPDFGDKELIKASKGGVA